MLPKILSQDSNYDEWCEQEILNAYQEAAQSDQYFFGDYDYQTEWLNDWILNDALEDNTLDEKEEG